jgi:hypothetical protein
VRALNRTAAHAALTRSNLQGKIKGSYTADKMIEFCRRGTLSARQLVLGIDRDLPYALRQVRRAWPLTRRIGPGTDAAVA